MVSPLLFSVKNHQILFYGWNIIWRGCYFTVFQWIVHPKGQQIGWRKYSQAVVIAVEKRAHNDMP
jgi:hypothetical protein